MVYLSNSRSQRLNFSWITLLHAPNFVSQQMVSSIHGCFLFISIEQIHAGLRSRALQDYSTINEPRAALSKCSGMCSESHMYAWMKFNGALSFLKWNLNLYGWNKILTIYAISPRHFDHMTVAVAKYSNINHHLKPLMHWKTVWLHSAVKKCVFWHLCVIFKAM